MVDAQVVNQYADGVNPQPFYPKTADVNCDAAITETDANLIADVVAEVQTGFECPGYLGLHTYDPWDYYRSNPPTQHHTYLSMNFVLYTHDQFTYNKASRVLDLAEACYLIHAEIAGPEWEQRVEYHSELELARKTLAYVDDSNVCGLGNNFRVEVGPPCRGTSSEIGTRKGAWIYFYEMQRGMSYGWYYYLFSSEVERVDWNNAFSHSVAIRCSELIGSGDMHPNVDYVKTSLVDWTNLASQQSLVSLLEQPPPTGAHFSGTHPDFGADDLIGAMLAELYERYGNAYMQQLVHEFTSGKYRPVTTPRTQACNFLLASDAVTGGDSHGLMVNEWRFPTDCGSALDAYAE